ncbi:MAG: D-2-hydroxyacid dehydrogenase [Gemmataceae bacterium]
MTKPLVLLLDWTPEGTIDRLRREVPELDFHDGRDDETFRRYWRQTAITYGVPPLDRLSEADQLRWVQLASAGVPASFRAAAQQRGLRVTNLAGLYGPTIAEHALALMLMLARNLHQVMCHQFERLWDDKEVARTMFDLPGKTLAIIGLGNIGQSLARVGKRHGLRVVGCRRVPCWVPRVDQVYPLSDLHAMLAEADIVAVTTPLTPATEGLLGPREFAAMKRGVLFVNVSRGAIAQEEALLDALRSGQVRGAALDAYAVEPLPAAHPFWAMPQVIVSPHYSGETVNLSSLPSERFLRNLRADLQGRELEGMVDLEQGY